MSLDLHKNAILFGVVDVFCLVCEMLMTSQEARSHVAEPAHAHNAARAHRVERFKDDHILKVKQGYFCVYCNEVFPTASKVTLHVADAMHHANKGAKILRREGAAIVYDELLLDESAWHGIVDDMCAVCNTEFDDETAHKKDSTHVFNLAKSKVEFGSKKAIYRKIDESTFQCITCNTALPLETLITHFEELNHKNILEIYAKGYLDLKQYQYKSSIIGDIVDSCKNVTKISGIENNTSGASDYYSSAESFDEESFSVSYTKLTNEENNMNILDFVQTFERNGVNINFENEIAFCTKCSTTVHFDCKAIENHIDEHTRNLTKRDVGYMPFQCEINTKENVEYAPNVKNDKTGMQTLAIDWTPGECPKLDINHNESDNASKSNEEDSPDDFEYDTSTVSSTESPKEFAEDNHITFNIGNNNAYCRLCKKKMPAHLRSMKEHVAGKYHKNRLGCLENEIPSRHGNYNTSSSLKISSEDFLEEVYIITNSILSTAESVVNREHCMDAFSFHLITKGAVSVLRCQLCGTGLWELDLKSHTNSLTHRLAFLSTPVLTKYKNTEFVREVRPGLLHCASCNLLVESEAALQVHFTTAEHRQMRARYQLQLARHLPGILEKERQERMSMLFMHMMIGRMARNF